MRTSTITPLFLAAATTGIFMHHAQAEDLTSTGAATLLARTQAVNVKCDYLSASEKDDLNTLAAEAELALANKTDVKSTQAALATGRKRGQGANCSEAEQANVRKVLNAALAATQGPADAAAIVEPAVAIAPGVAAPLAVVVTPKKTVVVSAPVIARQKAVEIVAQPLAQPAKKPLAQYAELTARYYKARRCNSMPAASMASFYKTVVSAHYKVLAAYGRPTVAAVMQKAEADANEASCG